MLSLKSSCVLRQWDVLESHELLNMKHLCMSRAVFASLLDVTYELRHEE